MDREVKSGLPPIVRHDARLLILGSLPGDASLAARQYYAHPTNQFWRLLGGAIGEGLSDLPYEARLRLVANRGVGLWDVIASAHRLGSLDQAMRASAPNPIADLVNTLPGLRAVAFNGKTAALHGRRMMSALGRPVFLLDLPSSSAANTMALEQKAAVWAQMADFLRDSACAPLHPRQSTPRCDR